MNLAYYTVLFDEATDALWHHIGLGEPYRERTGCGTFAVEAHTLYLNELQEGEATAALSWVIDADAKRLHIAHELYRFSDNTIAARQELMYLTVNLTTRRSVPWSAEVLAGLMAARATHGRPPWLGRTIAIPR